MTTTKQNKPIGRPRKFSKEEGLKHAEILFHQHGYDGVSVSDICTRLNVPPTSLYAAYGSKAKLYTLVLEQYSGLFFKGLEEALTNADSVAKVYRSTLEYCALVYTEQSDRPGSFFLDAALTVKDPDLSSMLKQHTQKLQNHLADTLENVRALNHIELAKSLIVLMRALSCEFKICREPEDLMITTEIFCSAFE